MKMIQFTKEETDALLTQINARLDYLQIIQIQESKKGNISRILE